MYNHRLASLLVCLSVAANLGLVAGCLAGAAGAGDPSDPDVLHAGTWTLYRSCTAVRDCNAEVRACDLEFQTECSHTCTTACSGTGTNCARCLEICGGGSGCTCRGTDGACEAWEYSFTRSEAPRNPVVEAACSAMEAACPTPSSDPAVCSAYATVESPDVAAPAYDCIRTSGCDGSYCQPPYDLATALYVCPLSGGENPCGDWEAAIAHNSGWWTQATRNAVRLCATQPMDMRGRCVEAFFTTIRTAVP